MAQICGLVVGLAFLALFTLPTRFALIYSSFLLLLGGWDGFAEAKSGRLNTSVPLTDTRGLPRRRSYLLAVLLGSVLFALIEHEWLGALAYILFFMAGVLLGINLFNAISDYRAGKSNGSTAK